MRYIIRVSSFPTQESSFFTLIKSCKKIAMLKHTKCFKISIFDLTQRFLSHIRVLNIKIISQINLFLMFWKKTIDNKKIKSGVNI